MAEVQNGAPFTRIYYPWDFTGALDADLVNVESHILLKEIYTMSNIHKESPLENKLHDSLHVKVKNEWQLEVKGKIGEKDGLGGRR